MAPRSRPSTPDTRSQKLHNDKPQQTELLSLRRFRDHFGLRQVSNNDLFSYTGVSKATGYRIFRDADRGVHDEPFIETRGRHRLLTEPQIQQIERTLNDVGYEACTLPWKSLCDAAGLEFENEKKTPSAVTVRKAMNDRGWHKCSTCLKYWFDEDTAHKRDCSAGESLHLDGVDTAPSHRIRHSDEVQFKSGPEGKMIVITRPDERHCTDCREARAKKHETAKQTFLP
ncbi:hypothetical protein F5Y18DRAFT_381448 [Xylariaceae sp. FL1019]|nr:hypothetical protein F5Y18DRAFT_381448 [Xylariaceae sp. FL1019]